MSVQESIVLLHVTREVVDPDRLPGQGECVHGSVVQVPEQLLSETQYARQYLLCIVN